MITGATGGVGFEMARRLLAEEFTVVLHARSGRRGEEALELLVKEGFDPLRMHLVLADFARLGEVATMAARVARAHRRIDVLVNNAAIAGTDERVLTEDGHEQTFQVNYLAPYLLTRMLEGALAEARRSRVVNLSSALHRTGRIDWADLTRERRYSRGAAYAQSKLALTMFTRALAEFGPDGLTAASVHPGVLDTPFLASCGCHARPAGEGADTVVRLCPPDHAIVNGAYYDEHLVPAGPAAPVNDRKAVHQLWRISERLTGLG